MSTAGQLGARERLRAILVRAAQLADQDPRVPAGMAIPLAILVATALIHDHREVFPGSFQLAPGGEHIPLAHLRNRALDALRNEDFNSAFHGIRCQCRDLNYSPPTRHASRAPSL